MKTKSLQTNAILNGIKQCCSIIYPLITFPYISRVLGKSGFGIYSFSLSIATYFIMLAALGINTYAVREGAKIRDNQIEIAEFCNQLFTINIISCLFSFGVLIITLLVNKKIYDYRVYILILSLAMFIDAVGTDWINSIYEDFFYITIRSILMQVISMALMFVFVRDVNDVIQYCIISIVAAHGGNLLNLFYIRRYAKVHITRHPNFKKHLKPLLILFVNTITVTIYVTADTTMLGFYYDDATVGVYSFTSRIYAMLKNIVYAIVMVSVPRISYILANSNKKETRRTYEDIFSLLTFFMLPITAGLFFTSKFIILIAGGTQYLEGNESLKILSIAIIFGILSSFYSDCVLIPRNLESRSLISTSITAIINVLLNFFFVPAFGINGAAITTLIAEFVNFICQFMFGRKYTRFHFINKRNLASSLVGTLFIALICVACTRISQSLLFFFIAVVLSVTTYALATIILKNDVAIKMVNKIHNRRK